MDLYTHTFRLPDTGALFGYRDPAQWAHDLVGLADAGRGAYVLDDADMPGPGHLMVRGTEKALRLIGVALNLHAEQSPSDPTPTSEADRLDATLAAPPRVTTGQVLQWLLDCPPHQLDRPFLVYVDGTYHQVRCIDYPDALTEEDLCASVTLGEPLDTRSL